MIADGSVAALLDGIAGTGPAPGSGAAGAIALALGVACARKAVRLTLAYRPGEAALIAADARLAAIGRAACAGADEDGRLFTALIADLKLGHADEPVRDAALREDAAALVGAGMRLIALGEALTQVLDAVAPTIRPAMANDVLAARALADAAETIQRANVAESCARL